MGQGRWDWDGLAVCVLAFAVYINTLDHGFVYDDHRAILTNPDVQPATPIIQVFHNDFWGTPLSSSNSHGSYRPITVLSFRLNTWATGLRSFGFHLTNVVLHVVASGLVLKTARVLLPGRSPTLGAALFAVHPVHVEAVASVVGRADVLAAIFYLMSFLFYVNHVKLREVSIPYSLKLNISSKLKPGSRKSVLEKSPFETYLTVAKDNLGVNFFKEVTWFPKGETFFFALFLVFAVLAVLSKEPAITVIPLAICYDIILHLRSKKLPFRNSSIVPSASASLFALVLIILIRFSIMGLHTPSFSKADNPIAKDSSIVTRILSFLYLPLFNFLLLVFPKSLSFDWSMDAIPRIHSILDYRFLSTILFYFSIGYALRISFSFSSFQKCKGFYKPKACKTCSNVSLETHFNSCRMLNNNNIPQKCICSDTHPHTSINRSAVMLCLAFTVLPFIPASNLFFYIGFVVAERVLYIPSIGFCLLVALGANALWSRERKSIVLTCCFLLLITLAARTVQRNCDWKDEESLYRSAINIIPPKAYGNLGSVLSTAGRLGEAEEALRLALQYRPNMADVHYNLGNLLNRQGKYEDAVKCYGNAIKYRPSLAVAYLNMGQTLETLGRSEEAERMYAKCVRLDSEGLKDPKAHEQAMSSCFRLLKRVCEEKGCGSDSSDTISDQERTLKSKQLKGYQVKGNVENKKPEIHSSSSDSSNNYSSHLQGLLKNKTVIPGEEERFLRLLHSLPNDPANYVSYGQLLAKQGRKDEAALLYLKAAQLQPQRHSLVTSAAVALRHAGRLAEAENLYRQARDLRPQDATSHSNLGAILHLQGKHKLAAASYGEALRLSPGDHITLANLQKLNNLVSRNKR